LKKSVSASNFDPYNNGVCAKIHYAQSFIHDLLCPYKPNFVLSFFNFVLIDGPKNKEFQWTRLQIFEFIQNLTSFFPTSVKFLL